MALSEIDPSSPKRKSRGGRDSFALCWPKSLVARAKLAFAQLAIAARTFLDCKDSGVVLEGPCIITLSPFYLGPLFASVGRSVLRCCKLLLCSRLLLSSLSRFTARGAVTVV